MRKYRPKSQGVLEAMQYTGDNLDEVLKAFGVEKYRRIYDEDTKDKYVCLDVHSKGANARVYVMIEKGDMLFSDDNMGLAKMSEKDFLDLYEAVDG